MRALIDGKDVYFFAESIRQEIALRDFFEVLKGTPCKPELHLDAGLNRDEVCLIIQADR